MPSIIRVPIVLSQPALPVPICVARRRHEVEVLVRPRLERGVGLEEHLCLLSRVLIVRVHTSDHDGGVCQLSSLCKSQ